MESRYYVVIATDQPERGALRQATRPAHREYLRSQRMVRVHAAGPLVTESGADITGTFVLCSAESGDAVAEFVAGDPYFHADLFKDIVIRRLDWTLGTPSQWPEAQLASHAVRFK